MWGVLSLVRRAMPRRRAARVVDESALGGGAGAAGDAARSTAASPGALYRVRALLAVAAPGADGAEEAWAASAWRPSRAPDEATHLMVRESLRYAIYAA